MLHTTHRLYFYKLHGLLWSLVEIFAECNRTFKRDRQATHAGNGSPHRRTRLTCQICARRLSVHKGWRLRERSWLSIKPYKKNRLALRRFSCPRTQGCVHLPATGSVRGMSLSSNSTAAWSGRGKCATVCATILRWLSVATKGFGGRTTQARVLPQRKVHTCIGTSVLNRIARLGVPVAVKIT